MRTSVFALLLALCAALPAQAAVYLPSETKVTGHENGWIRVTGSTGSTDPMEVSVALTVSGTYGLECDGRYGQLYCSNGFAFQVMTRAFESLMTLSGGDYFATLPKKAPLPVVPVQTARTTEVVLKTTVQDRFSFDFRFDNQGGRLQSFSVSAAVFTTPPAAANADTAAVPLPASSGLLASGLLAAVLMGRRSRRRRAAA